MYTRESRTRFDWGSFLKTHSGPILFWLLVLGVVAGGFYGFMRMSKLQEASRQEYEGIVVDRSSFGRYVFTIRLDEGSFRSFETPSRQIYDQMRNGARVNLIGKDNLLSHPSEILFIDEVISVTQPGDSS